MPTITSLGVGSGLDLSGLLDQLKSAESAKLEPIIEQRANYKAKLSAFGKLENALESLRESAAALDDADTFQALDSQMEGDAVSVSTDASAMPGRYQIDVKALAQAQTLASGGFEEAAELDLGELSFSVGDETFSITLDADNNTLEGLRDAINAQGAGIGASIINDGSVTPQRLVLTATETGETNQIAISSTTAALQTAFGFDSGAPTAGDMRETVAAQDAALSVNGIAITSTSNHVEGALQGVTLDLKATNEGAADALTLSRDDAAIKGSINDFVNAYNSLQGTMSSLTSFDAETGAAGELLGNSTLRGVESQLRNAMGRVGGGDYALLSNMGISLALDGKLEIDDDTLDGAIADNLDGVRTFFAGDEESGGFAADLDTVLDSLLDDGGALDTATSGIDTSLERLGERYTSMQASIDATVDRYRTQFADLDALVSQMNSTSSYLTQQFDSLNAQLNQ
ncbi:flagellar hook-associated protein 2 [Chromohalobacter marismortui]|uniref:Flagellar hook-associated protein 2 n=1 Tax=Chromohalobacter marismortui TaxID=42055 RepID=A0A4R7NQR5_9GAMM|nr:MULTISPECIES: flagellar filament capping protein FliD [Chromohalobacter]MCI0508782.1 flagellar filament capping protein FliD [Chromohalobacter sp.]MCI0594573.1 flagellar filament capping protein FliD [Chromohalobacter sp.]TDU22851.1 flagellar hook-associated protein 2 [Chromohalobacter marismortui]